MDAYPNWDPEQFVMPILKSNMMSNVNFHEPWPVFCRNLLAVFASCWQDKGFIHVLFSVDIAGHVDIIAQHLPHPDVSVNAILDTLEPELFQWLRTVDFAHKLLAAGDKAQVFVAKLASGPNEQVFLAAIDPRLEQGFPAKTISLLSEMTQSLRKHVQVYRRISLLEQENTRLATSIHQLRVSTEINTFLVKTVDEEDIYSIILLGLTARQGLGFNRCFLFTLDQASNCLCGHRALGPVDAAEAGAIWSRVEKQFKSFSAILSSFRTKDIWENPLNQLVKTVRIPLANGNPFAQLFAEPKPKFITYTEPFKQVAPAFFARTNLEAFTAYPVKTWQQTLGLLLADNLFTGRTPTQDQLSLMHSIVSHAATLIENARLYGDLQDKIATLKKTNQELDKNRQLFLRVQRLSISGEIIAKIAHNLKNPLVTIGGFAKSLQKEGLDVETVLRFSHIIADEVRKIEASLDNILNFWQEQEQEYAFYPVNQLIDASVSLLKNEIPDADAHVHQDIDPLLPQLKVDKNQIVQVLINIIKNAFDACQKAGNSPDIRISAFRSGEFLVLSIKDNGVGIPEAHIDKLFKAFYSTEETGTGLGLTVSMQIMRLHKGYISVKSDPGAGATFFIHLPLSAAS